MAIIVLKEIIQIKRRNKKYAIFTILNRVYILIFVMKCVDQYTICHSISTVCDWHAQQMD